MYHVLTQCFKIIQHKDDDGFNFTTFQQEDCSFLTAGLPSKEQAIEAFNSSCNTYKEELKKQGILFNESTEEYSVNYHHNDEAILTRLVMIDCVKRKNETES